MRLTYEVSQERDSALQYLDHCKAVGGIAESAFKTTCILVKIKQSVT